MSRLHRSPGNPRSISGAALLASTALAVAFPYAAAAQSADPSSGHVVKRGASDAVAQSRRTQISVSANGNTAPIIANNSSGLAAPTATGTDALAAGDGANSTGNNSASFGEGANAAGTSSVAIGQNSFANGVFNGGGTSDVVADTTAVGQFAHANGAGSTAIGQGAVADGAVKGDATQSVVFGYTTAVGQNAQAVGAGSTALGQGAVAYGNLTVAGNVASGYTTAVGQNAQALGNAATAVGQNANAASDLDTAIGQASKATGVSGTAVGQAATVGDYSAAVGNFATADTIAAAFGYQAHAATYSTAVGPLTTVSGYYSVGVGYSSGATSNYSSALGVYAHVSGDYGLALGWESATSGDHSVALGANSSDQGLAGVVSLGNPELTRRIIDLAPGINGTDAVNLNQLQSVQTDTGNGLGQLAATTAANFGGGSAVGATSYSGITAPTYTIQGSTYHDVGSAFQGVDTELTKLEGDQGGGGTSAPPSPVQYSTAAAPTTANPGTVSNDATLVGSGTAPVALHNVAAGSLTAGSTDAVNGGQLQSVQTATGNGLGQLAATTAANFGGGSAVGATSYSGITAPTYTIQGSTYHDVGSALQGVDTELTKLEGDQGGGGTSALSPVQYSTAAAPTTANPGTASNDATLVGSGTTPVTLHNVAAGSVSSGSTDAVNGSQLYATNAAVTTAQNTADTAVTNAAAAQTTASNALSLATTANTTANTAITTANTAITTANTANTTANTALARTAYIATNYTGAAPVASGTNSVAIGAGSVSQNGAAVTLGYEDTSSGDSAVAVGSSNSATGQGAVAIGRSSTAGAASSIALGDTASAASVGNVAIGQNASASGANSVAIGAGSSDGGQSNVVSVGSVGAERRITNVAPGINGTDAVNVNQLTAAMASTLASANAYTNQQIANVNFDLGQLRNHVNQGVAAAMAMADAPFPSAPGRTSYTANTAIYYGKVAFSASLSHRLNTDSPFAITGAVTYGGGNGVGGRAGVAGEF